MSNSEALSLTHLLGKGFSLPSVAQQEKKDEAIREAKAIADQEMDKVPLGSGCILHGPQNTSLINAVWAFLMAPADKTRVTQQLLSIF